MKTTMYEVRWDFIDYNGFNAATCQEAPLQCGKSQRFVSLYSFIAETAAIRLREEMWKYKPDWLNHNIYVTNIRVVKITEEVVG